MPEINKRFFFKSCVLPFVCLFLFFSKGNAQIAEDAVLLSRLQTTGTARIQGLAGTGFALGGDASAAYINPAGLGFFNRSSIVFTPTFNYVSANTNYEGVTMDAFNTRFNISNFGIVFNNSKDEDDLIPSNWRGGSFAITYNAINSYNYQYNYGPATGLNFSIIDEFVRQSNGIPVSELDENISGDNPNIIGYPEAAYNNYLINADPATGTTYVASIPAEVTTTQEGDLIEEIRLNQWDFAYGGNYKDKLYAGLSLGFRSFSYNRKNEYRELFKYAQDYIDNNLTFFPVDDQFSIQFVDSLRLNESMEINGSGINASLGLIYRPIQELTIGLSYQTPTFYSLNNEESFDLTSNVRNIQPNDDPNSAFDSENALSRGNLNVAEYSLSTPSRIGVGLAYFFEKYGFLTADVEYVNYESNRFVSNDFSTSDLNQGVDDLLEPVINYRVGGEFRYEMLRFRLGYAINQDPTQIANDQVERDQQTLSGGIGIYLPSFFADLTVSNIRFESDFTPYLGAPYYLQENNITKAVVTLGFNF